MCHLRHILRVVPTAQDKLQTLKKKTPCLRPVEGRRLGGSVYLWGGRGGVVNALTPSRESLLHKTRQKKWLRTDTTPFPNTAVPQDNFSLYQYKASSPRLARVPEPDVLELEAHAPLGAGGEILGVGSVHDVRRLVQQLRQVADVDESLRGRGNEQGCREKETWGGGRGGRRRDKKSAGGGGGGAQKEAFGTSLF